MVGSYLQNSRSYKTLFNKVKGVERRTALQGIFSYRVLFNKITVARRFTKFQNSISYRVLFSTDSFLGTALQTEIVIGYSLFNSVTVVGPVLQYCSQPAPALQCSGFLVPCSSSTKECRLQYLWEHLPGSFENLRRTYHYNVRTIARVKF